MGTSLNGLTPASTYQGLIKTTDNAAISGTAKYLSDGLGNDSVLALSTGAVGIGTSSPSGILSIVDSYHSTFWRNANFGTSLLLSADAGSDQRTWQFSSRFQGTNRIDLAVLRSTNGTTYGSSPTGLSYAEVARFTENGLTFNGDTAAANALDDYEEGTWTPSLGGNTTYTGQVGTYTKIGRQVTVHFVVGVTTLGTGSAANITGLPFTSFSSNRGAGGVAFIDAPSTGYASINPAALVNSTTLAFTTSTILGVWADQSNVFTDGTTIAGTVTYFV